MPNRYATAAGSAALVIALVLFAVSFYTVYEIAKDPTARLAGLKSTVGESTQGPSASFTWSSNGYSVTIVDTSTDNGSTITAWFWSFGDGSFYSGPNPGTHRYTSTCGQCTENVTLGINDSAGGHSATSTNVVIQEFGQSNGSAQSPLSSVKIPQVGGFLTQGLVAIELVVIMLLIAVSVTRAAWNLLRREPQEVSVPVRPQVPSAP